MANRNIGTEEISSREFQRKLFDWFEKRGLLSELRAFMRHRMISALYSSESPCPSSCFTTDASVSPTLQAMLLLVAEFLVQQEYHYTMSVMVAEAPLLASFPKFSGYVSYMSRTDAIQKGCNFPRYSERDVQEILEVFGLTPDSESMTHVLRLYSSNNARESLLACVLTALSVIVQTRSNDTSKGDKTSKNRPKTSDDTDNSAQWIEEIRLVLLRAQLTSRQLQQVEDLLCKLHADTADKVRREEREKNRKMNHIREQEFLAESLVREERFRAQTVEADEDLRSKQKHLEQVTNQLRQQHDEVLHRLNRVQKHADEVKKQENELMEREKAFEKKQSLFEEEYRTLAGLRAELQEATLSLRQEHSGTKTILELNHLQDRCLHLESELKETKERILTSAVHKTEIGIQATENFGHMPSVPIGGIEQSDEHYQSSGSSLSSGIGKPKEKKERNNQVALLKRVLRRVQQENSELRAIAAQQRRRIDEVTSRAAQLANHLAEQSETPRTEQPVSVAEAPERHPPHQPPQHISNNSPFGAGGDVRQATSRHSPVFTPHSLRGQGRDWRRKPPPRRFIQNSSLTTSLSSDDSPTEEVLREARNRLKKLEDESEAVDRRYRDFRARRADSLIPTASMLIATNEQTLAGLTTDQSYPDTNHLVAPPQLQSTPFSLPTTNRYTSPSLATSVRPPSATLLGATSSFSAFPRSQFTFPERSLYSLSQASSPSRLLESVPFHSSALRRPTDRLRNVLGSRPSFTRGFTQGSGSAPGPDQNGPTTTHAHEEKASSVVSRSIPEMQRMNLNPSSEKVEPWDSRDLHGKTLSAGKDGDFPKDATITENQQNLETPLQYPTGQVDGRVDSDRPVIELVQPTLNGSQSTLGLPQNGEKFPLNPARPPLNAEISPLNARPVTPPFFNINQPDPPFAQESPTNVQQHPPVSSVDVENPPASLNKAEHHSVHAPLPSSEIIHSPERHILKPNLVDSTLNEISTLSSSPGLSSAIVGSVKTKVISSSVIAQDETGKVNRKPVSSDSLSIEDRKKQSKQENGTSNFAAMQVQQNGGETSAAGRSSQLLNTSLSSIEKSDQQLSAGSGEKRTDNGDDDDDDFW